MRGQQQGRWAEPDPWHSVSSVKRVSESFTIVYLCAKVMYSMQIIKQKIQSDFCSTLDSSEVIF